MSRCGDFLPIQFKVGCLRTKHIACKYFEIHNYLGLNSYKSLTIEQIL